jgi:hypothetical protein
MVSKDKKIKRELKKLKKAKKAKKIRRKSRAALEIKQIVNLRGLGPLKTTQAQQPVVFQSQSERPASGTSDFLANAISQLNRVNSPNTNIRNLEDNLRRLESEVRNQKIKNNQILTDRDMLQKKYQSIAGQTDNVGDFSMRNTPRNVAKEEEKFQDRSTISPRRGRPRGPQSQEEKQRRAEQREKKKLIARLAEKNEGLFESSMTEGTETEDEDEPYEKEQSKQVTFVDDE